MRSKTKDEALLSLPHDGRSSLQSKSGPAPPGLESADAVNEQAILIHGDVRLPIARHSHVGGLTSQALRNCKASTALCSRRDNTDDTVEASPGPRTWIHGGLFQARW